MWVPWHPVLPPQTASPWWSGVMSKRATAQSAFSSLVHIYKPTQWRQTALKRPGWQTSVHGRGWKKRWTQSMKELQALAGPPSNNEVQIAMGTRSSLLLPCWTNNEQWLGLKTQSNICAFYIFNFNKTHFFTHTHGVCLCNRSNWIYIRFSLHRLKDLWYRIYGNKWAEQNKAERKSMFAKKQIKLLLCC